MKVKIAIFTTLLLGMLFYIGWIFYMSEPKYIDNPQTNEVKRYDYVSIRPYENIENYLYTGIVLQIDTTSFQNHYVTVKCSDGSYRDIYINGATRQFKIIGTGTFYHKVNAFVGFNIMMITTLVIAILAIVILITLIGLIREFLGWSY